MDGSSSGTGCGAGLIVGNYDPVQQSLVGGQRLIDAEKNVLVIPH